MSKLDEILRTLEPYRDFGGFHRIKESKSAILSYFLEILPHQCSVEEETGNEGWNACLSQITEAIEKERA